MEQEFYIEKLERQLKRLNSNNKRLRERIKNAKAFAEVWLDQKECNHLLKILDGKDINFIETKKGMK